MFSGLSFLMKMRKENYVDELVRKERLVAQCKARKAGGDQAKTWRDDEYLVARLRRYCLAQRTDSTMHPLIFLFAQSTFSINYSLILCIP